MFNLFLDSYYNRIIRCPTIDTTDDREVEVLPGEIMVTDTIDEMIDEMTEVVMVEDEKIAMENLQQKLIMKPNTNFDPFSYEIFC